MSNERIQAIQAVVDRLSSYQEGATDGTVEKELRDALSETDVDLTDEEVTKLATALEGLDEGDGKIVVDEVLG